MDLALSRLRIPAADPACPLTSGLCADTEAYERLISEVAMAAAPQVTTAAHTHGPRSFSVGLYHSLTSVDSGGVPFRRGTVGPDPNGELNPDPAGVLSWSRFVVRKGLPLGLDVAADVGHGWNTSMWAIGGRLKLAILEGFHSELGALPDVAIEVATQAVVGARDLNLWTHALHLTVSRVFVVFDRVRLAPLVAMQALLVDASAGAVDLAADLCQDEATCDMSLQQVVRFPNLTQVRFRWVLGLQAQVAPVRLFANLSLEAPPLSVEDPGRAYGGDSHTVQVATTLGLGADF